MRPRAVGKAAPRRSPTPVAEAPIDLVHMIRESTYDKNTRKVVVVTLCGETGRPYGYPSIESKNMSGIRNTCFASVVTCPDCRKEPGVIGPPPIL